MPSSRISIAVHRLTRLYVSVPATRMTLQQIHEFTGLEPEETRIVVDALKDAGLLDEQPDGLVMTRVAAG